MLRKLLKHEFRATGRVMLPLYLVLLVTAMGANLSARGLLSTPFRLLDVLGSLLVAAFFIAIFAVFIMSFVVMVQRFYRNLLQDEGYVMMTLPVSVHQHLWSKLIVSAVWFAATLLMVCLAGMVMSFEMRFVLDGFRFLWESIQNVSAYYAANGAAFLAEFLALCFFASCAMCLQVYAALAVGHSFANHKMAWSVGCFFLSVFAMQFLISALVIVMDSTGLDFVLAKVFYIEGMAGMHAMMLFLCVCVILYGAVFYFITTFFLKKHLNLE